MTKKTLKAKKNNRGTGNSTDKTKYWFSVNDLISIYDRKKSGIKESYLQIFTSTFVAFPQRKCCFTNIIIQCIGLSLCVIMCVLRMRAPICALMITPYIRNTRSNKAAAKLIHQAITSLGERNHLP